MRTSWQHLSATLMNMLSVRNVLRGHCLRAPLGSVRTAWVTDQFGKALLAS